MIITDLKEGDLIHLMEMPEEGFKAEDAIVVGIDEDTNMVVCSDKVDTEAIFEVSIDQVEYIIK